MIRKIVAVFCLCVCTCMNLFCQTVIGKYAGEFLAIGVGGRALGMGSAQTAIANDVTAGYWNPAGLASMDYPQIALMHEEHFGSLVSYNYAAVAIPYGTDMSFGISVMRSSIDGIPDTRNAGAVHPQSPPRTRNNSCRRPGPALPRPQMPRPHTPEFHGIHRQRAVARSAQTPY